MRLHLIRHGQTLWNAQGRIQGWSDSDLDETGRLQARQCQAVLRNLPIVAVYSSPAGRARQTTSILESERNLPVKLEPDLREMHLGPWEGLHWEEIDELDPDAADLMRTARHRFVLDGAERLEQTQARGIACVQRIAKTLRGVASGAAGSDGHDANPGEGDALIVSHGVLIKSVLLHYSAQPLSAYNAAPRLANCSHSIIEYDRSGTLRTVQWGEPTTLDAI